MKSSPAHGVFADTSYFYATLDEDDVSHISAINYAECIETRQIPVISTWEIVLETVVLLRYRHGYEASMIFIQKILPSLQLIDLSQDDRQNVLKLYERFSSDKKVSLCDIVSYFIITKHLKNMPSLAFDDDFRSLGLAPFVP